MDSVKKVLSRWSRIELVAYLGIAVFTCIAAWSAFMRPFGHDEFEAMHTAWKMFSGERIYIDFFQHHHFLFYDVLSWLIAWFGADADMILASRALSFLMAIGIVFLAYRLAKMTLGKEAALLSALLLSTTFMFLDKVIEVRPDVPQALSGMLAVFFLLRYLESGRRLFLLLVPVSLFVSFLFLQKAVFLVALLGLYTLYRVMKKTMKISDFTLLWGLFVVFLGIFVSSLVLSGVWSEYLFLNWTVNTQLMNTFFLLKYLWISFTENPVFWLAYLGGIVLLFRKKGTNLFVFLSLGLLGTVFLTKTPFAQYYLMALPFVAIVAAQAMLALSAKCLRCSIALLVLSAIYPAYLVFDEVGNGNGEQLRKIEYVMEITGPDDLVYDGDANFNIFRKDMDYFWFSVRPKKGVLAAYQSLRPYEYDAYDLIAERKPKVVSDSFIKPKKSAIADFYVQSDRYPDLFIRK